MKITTNGDEQRLDGASVTIAKLLEISKVEQPDMVSVQLNGSFVEKDAYATTIASDGDEVDFLYFMGGGSER